MAGDRSKFEGHVDILGDTPIQSVSQDILGRADFAKALSQALVGWQGHESLVVALCGPWGTGKSSIKNMAKAHIEAAAGAPAVVEFNPWQWSGQNLLAEAFLREVGIAIGRADPTALGRARKATFQRYAVILQAGGHLLAGLAQAMPVILGVSLMLGLNFALVPFVGHERTVQILAAIALSAAAFTNWWARLVEFISEVAASVLPQDETLSETKAALAEQLRGMQRGALVVVDDIDRLTAEEVRHLFQLVKANTDLPKLVFLLLFDRQTVARFLTAPGVVDGDKYLEKIIQVSFDVPAARDTDIHATLFKRLNSIVDSVENAPTFDVQRWGNLFYGGVRSYFGSLRDVYRFSSMMGFQVGLFRGAKAFEANLVDLIGLEVLRTFEPAVYARLPALKDLLTGTAVLPRDADAKAAWESLIALSQPSKRESVSSILTSLFPTVDKYIENRRYSAGFQEEWIRTSRVCAVNCFDYYFQLTWPPDTISESETRSLIEEIQTPDEFVRHLRQIRERGAFGDAIDRLSAWEPELDSGRITNFIYALSEISDEISYSFNGVEFPQFFEVGRLARRALKRLAPEDRAIALQRAVESGGGLGLVAFLIDREDGATEEKDESDVLIDEGSLRATREAWLKKIDKRAQDGAPFLAMESLAHVASRWAQWQSPVAAQQWAEQVCSTKGGLERLTAAFIDTSVESGVDEHVGRTRSTLNMKNFLRLVPEGRCRELLEQAERDGRQSPGLSALRMALRAKDGQTA